MWYHALQVLLVVAAIVIALKLLPNGQTQVVPAPQLHKDDIVVVVAGEFIPGDGEIIAGVASVDESAITGESAPVIREAGAKNQKRYKDVLELLDNGINVITACNVQHLESLNDVIARKTHQTQ